MNRDLESAIFRLEAIVNQPRIAFSIPTNEAKAILEELKPTECVHPYFDVKTFYDKNCEVVKCTKCDRVIERGYSSEVRDE